MSSPDQAVATVYEGECVRAELGGYGEMVIITEGTTLPEAEQNVVGVQVETLFTIARNVWNAVRADDRVDPEQQRLGGVSQ
jgi:hypothetical protein